MTLPLYRPHPYQVQQWKKILATKGQRWVVAQLSRNMELGFDKHLKKGKNVQPL